MKDGETERLTLPECPHCGYVGELKQVLEPRPSSKKSEICPSCLEVVK